MVRLTGTLTEKETSRGVAGALAVLVALGRDAAVSSIAGAETLEEALKHAGAGARRLGSTTTGTGGAFAVEATLPETVGHAETEGPQMLVLIACGPSEPGNGGGVVLGATGFGVECDGQAESVLLRVQRDRVAAAGLAAPEDRERGEALAETAGLRASEAAGFRAGLDAGAQAALSDARQFRARIAGFRDRVRASLSVIPDKPLKPERIVPEGASVEAANMAAVTETLNARINGVGRRTRFYLTTAQRQALGPALAPGNQIGFGALRSAMTGGAGTGSTVQLLRDEPALLECMQRTSSEHAAAVLTGLEDEPEEEAEQDDGGAAGGNGPGGPGLVVGGRGVEVDVKGGITRVISDLVNAITPSETGKSTLPARPTPEDIRQSVDKLSLTGGPADRPATYDFHSLQIAFDHVWRELVDEDVVDEAEAVYARVVDLGGDPDDVAHDGKAPLDALRDEAAAVEITLARGVNPHLFAMKRPGLRTGLRPGLGDIFDPLLPVDPFPPLEPPPPPPPPPPVPPRPPFDTGQVYEPGNQVMDPGPRTLFERLRARLRRPYAFTIFGADSRERSVNFGLVVTYRQTWTPISYQAGRLVSTLPLGPKQSKTVKIVHRSKTSYARKQVDKHSSERSRESQETSRAEDEIVRKAQAKSNFSLSAQGTYDIGLAEGTSTTTVGTDSAKDSAETKKSFREAVYKAAQAYASERSVEVTEEEETGAEREETSQISNPNDAISVTFLYYELQRRYKVHEAIHRVTPVVLVAQEVPKTSEIDDAWLIAHDWILKRIMLDDSYLPTLEYLSRRMSGDAQALGHLAQLLADHRKIVEVLRSQLVVLQSTKAETYRNLQGAIAELAEQVKDEETDSIWSNIGEYFGKGGGEAPEAARVIERGARDAFDKAVAEEKELTMKLEREVSALQATSERYQKVLEDHNNWKIQIERLKLHVRDNMLHYMQGIWTHEVPDQRYFRLYQVKVPRFDENGTTYTVTGEPGEQTVITAGDGEIAAADAVDFQITPTLDVRFDQAQSLVEVADLDTLLGFKGNYAIFPLKESNALTDVMMDPYVTAGFEDILRLFDPDEAGAMNREDFAKLVVCLRETLGEQGFEGIKEALKSQYRRLLKAAIRLGEEIVVPTGSLFIELLTGEHELMEDFKLRHREIDVRKEEAAKRREELENLRLALRLVEAEGNLDLLSDPEIDRQVIIGGKPDNLLIDDD